MTALAKWNVSAALGAAALAALTAGCATSGGSAPAYRSSAYYTGADRLYRDDFVKNTRPHSAPTDAAPLYAGAPPPRTLASFDGIAGARLAHEIYPEPIAEQLDGACEPNVKLLQNETLYDVERYCDITVSMILAYNPRIRSARHVRGGATLEVPQIPNPERDAFIAATFGAPNQSYVGAVAYVVQPGDTLNSISGRHLVSAAAVANANPSIDWRATPVGQTIWIPASGGNQIIGAPSLVTPLPQPQATTGSLPYNYGAGHAGSDSGVVYDVTGVMPYVMTPAQQAAENEAPRSLLRINRRTVEPGGDVTVSGENLPKNAEVSLYGGPNGSQLQYLKTVRTDENGAFSETVTVTDAANTGGVIFEATVEGEAEERFQSPRVGVAN
jgi:LysM repeat protein